ASRRSCAARRWPRRCTSATTPPTSTRSAGCAGSRRRASSRPRCASPSPPTKRRRSSRRRRTSRWTGQEACGGCSRRCCRPATVRFVDFLRTTVLLSAGAATALAIVTVLAGASASDQTLVLISAGWWLIATVAGLRLGRRNATSSLPEQHPSAILLNRLWPLLVFTLLAGGLAFLAPQIPGIAAGFAIIW